MKTIVALYDDLSTARRVLDDLDAAGLRNSFQIMGGASARSSAGMAGSSTGTGSVFGTDDDSPSSRIATLNRAGVPHEDAEIYAEGVRRGGVLLVGKVDDSKTDDALDVIEQHGPVDIDDRGRHYRSSGWAGYDTSATDYDEAMATEERSRYRTGLGAAAAGMRDVNVPPTTADTTAERRADTRMDTATGTGMGTGREESIPIIEEQVHVGKREVARGRMRVRSYMVETPVEETVRLRDESIHVERRAVDRPAGSIPESAFQDRTIEVTETDEEAVVAKEARVREEVVIRKDVEERAQTVSDTVRHTEVEIEDDRARTDRPVTDQTATDRPMTDRPATDPGRRDV